MGDARLETVTVVFTDVVASTPWRVRVGGRTADEQIAGLERASRNVIAASGGTVVKSLGDGVMATFTSAAAALDAAAALQALGRRLAIGGTEDCLRVGVSSGDLMREGTDWVGTAAIEASRLCGEAAGGSVLVADATARLLRGRGEHELQPVAARVLRGFSDGIEVYELVGRRDGDRALPSAIAQAATGPLVGRGTEIARAFSMLEEVADGAARTMFLVGEPGIGKTRLAAAIASDAHDREFTVLHGRCDDGLAAPYQPVVEAFGPWVAGCPDAALAQGVGPAVGELVQLWPALATRLPTTASDEAVEPEARRWRMLQAVAALVRAVAAERPLLLVIDDLQWAEPSTRRLLGHLVRQGTERTAMLATLRPGEGGQGPGILLGDLGTDRVIDVIGLVGFDDGEVAELVSLHAGDRPPDGLIAHLRRHTDGNPFLLGALLAHLDAVAFVRRGDGAWVGAAELEAAGIPASARGVIDRRLAMLEPPTRRALDVAAVLGLEFDEHTIRSVLTTGADESVAALEGAVVPGLIRETGAGRFAFVHAIVRQTVLDTALSRTGLARLHWRVAEALERAPGHDRRLGEIAYHYAVGADIGDRATVVRSSLAAADEAITGAAFEEAAGHLRTVLATLDRMAPDPELRFRALLLLGQSLNALADVEGSERVWLDAADVARELGDPQRLFSAVVGYSYVIRVRGDIQITEMLDDALDLLGPEDSPLRASVLGWRAVPGFPSGRFRGAWRKLDTVNEAVAMARRTGDPGALALTLRSRAILEGYSPDAVGMLRDIEEVVALGRVGGVAITNDTASIHRDHTIALMRLGRRTDAEECLMLAKEEARRNGLRTSMASALIIESALARASGRFADAKALAAEAAARSGPEHLLMQLVYSGQVIGIRMEEGRLGDVIASIRDIDRTGIEVPAWRAMLADALADDGRRAEASIELARLVDDSPSAFLDDLAAQLSVRHLTEACRKSDDAARATALLPHVQPWAGQLLVPALGMSIDGASDRSVGHLLATTGRYDEADDAYERAVDLERSAGFPALVARTEYWHARLLLDRDAPGDRERARALFDSVIETADPLGMRLLATQARQCLH